MVLIINNEHQECSPETTIATLLVQKEMTLLKGLAVAINEVVLPKSEWQTYPLQPNDRITIIRASQGG